MRYKIRWFEATGTIATGKKKTTVPHEPEKRYICWEKLVNNHYFYFGIWTLYFGLNS